MVVNWASHHAAILSTGDELMKPFHSDLQFSSHELVWLNTLGRAQQWLKGRGGEGGGSQPSFCPLSSGLRLTVTEEGRMAGREVSGGILQNVKHSVGGGFV